MNRTQTLSGPLTGTSPFRVAQWRMLLAAMFCYLFFYTGRQTFGFAIPGIQAEFGLSKETLGWASSAMLWMYAIGQAINGNELKRPQASPPRAGLLGVPITKAIATA